MASHHKRGSGYTVRWRDHVATYGEDGNLQRRNRSRQVPNARLARQLCRDIEEAHALGRNWEPEAPAPLPRDLEELFADYLVDRSRALRAGSVRQLEIALGQYVDSLRADLGPARLVPEHLTRRSLAAYFDHLVSVRGVKRATAGHRVRMVSSVWSHLFDTDETGEVPQPRRLRDLPSAAYPAKLAPTWAEMDAAVQAAPGWYRELFVVLRYTGLRKSQAMRLRWDDLDLNEGLLVVRPELGKTQQERTGRRVPVSPHLVAEVAGWGRREGWLIDTGSSGRTVDRPSIVRAWREAGVRPEVWAGRDSERGQPTHAFRHGIISGLLQAGAREYLIRRLVGHAQPGVTTGIYADLDGVLLAELREVVALIPRVGDSGAVRRLGVER